MNENPYAPPETASEARKWRFLARGTTARRWRFRYGSYCMLVAIVCHGSAYVVAQAFLWAVDKGMLELSLDVFFRLVTTGFVGGKLLTYLGLALVLTSKPRRSRKWRRNCLWTRALLPARFRRPRLADRRMAR